MAEIFKVQGILAYTCAPRPVKLRKDADEEVTEGKVAPTEEWKVTVILTDKAQKKTLQDLYKKLKVKNAIKEVAQDEFEEEYKIPYPEDAGDEVWAVTLRKKTTLGYTGKAVPDQYRPKIFILDENKNRVLFEEENNVIANGSKGIVSFSLFERSSGNNTIELANILVTDFIRYERPESSGEAGSEFDDVATETEAKAEEKPAKAAKEKPTAKSTKTKADAESPF